MVPLRPNSQDTNKHFSFCKCGQCSAVSVSLYLELILKNADLVMARPELFYIRYGWMLVGGIYVGSKYIPLGVLLKLWQSGRWMGECPDCGGAAYIFKAGGSPLSGRHYIQAVCPACRNIVSSKKHEPFTTLMKEALDLCGAYTYTVKQKIYRRNR